MLPALVPAPAARMKEKSWHSCTGGQVCSSEAFAPGGNSFRCRLQSGFETDGNEQHGVWWGGQARDRRASVTKAWTGDPVRSGH
jgi:hypothetical protein